MAFPLLYIILAKNDILSIWIWISQVKDSITHAAVKFRAAYEKWERCTSVKKGSILLSTKISLTDGLIAYFFLFYEFS